MKFVPTSISGVWIIQQDRHEDDRGWFARTWCESEFAAHGISTRFAQCNASFNKQRGTLRGMHLQDAPHAEAKLVRCTRGAMFDVALDLRPGSPTFGKWEGVELTEENGTAFFIPEGCAHGFQTLADATEVFYQISVPYHPGSGRCWAWNDPVFDIRWPFPAGACLSPRDAAAPCYPSSQA
jgi:dTDP-4-dehydrorhamnose 3,5-epimerase